MQQLETSMMLRVFPSVIVFTLRLNFLKKTKGKISQLNSKTICRRHRRPRQTHLNLIIQMKKPIEKSLQKIGHFLAYRFYCSIIIFFAFFYC